MEFQASPGFESQHSGGLPGLHGEFQPYSYIVTSCLKQQKRAGGIAQVIRHLTLKDESLSSNPSTTEKKKGGGGSGGERLKW
jgi:hypothetical protein